MSSKPVMHGGSDQFSQDREEASDGVKHVYHEPCRGGPHCRDRRDANFLV